jgi:hypothetical protein
MEHIKDKVYVMHTCKNSKLNPKDPNYCDRAWVDVDKTNVQDTPPTWKYCPECVKKGFKNPRERKGTISQEQIEAFKERMKRYREGKNNDNL